VGRVKVVVSIIAFVVLVLVGLGYYSAARVEVAYDPLTNTLVLHNPGPLPVYAGEAEVSILAGDGELVTLRLEVDTILGPGEVMTYSEYPVEVGFEPGALAYLLVTGNLTLTIELETAPYLIVVTLPGVTVESQTVARVTW